MTRIQSRLVVAVVATVAAGCGGGPSDAEQIRTTVSDWARAMADDHPRACRLMTPELGAELMGLNGDLGHRSCPAMLDAVMSLSTDEERATMRRTRVTKVTVDGDRPVIRVAHSTVTSTQPGYVRRVRGRWLVDTPSAREPARRPGGWETRARDSRKERRNAVRIRRALRVATSEVARRYPPQPARSRRVVRADGRRSAAIRRR